VTTRARQLSCLVALVALLGAAGCGSSGDDSKGAKLPAASVAELNQRLNEIERRYADARQNDNAGACQDIQDDSFAAISKTIDALPEDVDGQLRDAVTQSFANLQQLTQDGCQDVGTKTETETTPTETTPPETVPPQTTPPETTPTETTPTQTTTTPKQNDSNGNGNGNGNGNTKKNNGGATPQTGNGNGAGGGTEAPSGGGN
jgi:hypothetical protein